MKFFLVPFKSNDAILEQNDPICHDLQAFEVVSHDNRGEVFLLIQSSNVVRKGFPGEWIQTRRRFVVEDDFGTETHPAAQ